MALRGDPPHGQENWTAVEGGFNNAIDLVKYIRQQYGDYFGIAVAGHPEGHIDNPDKEDDLRHLKAKVDAGADLIVTQLFYDVDTFLNFVEQARAIGITCPILPGIFPIQNYNGLKRVISFNNNQVPQKIWDDLEPIKDDDAAVKEYGIQLSMEFINKFIEAGIKGVHFYTFNLERSTRIILERMGLVPQQATVKPLPWAPVCEEKIVIVVRCFFCKINRIFYPIPTSLFTRSAPKKTFVLFSGKIAQRVIFSVPNHGMSSPMVDGEIRDHLLLANWMDMECHWSTPRTNALTCGTTPPP